MRRREDRDRRGVGARAPLLTADLDRQALIASGGKHFEGPIRRLGHAVDGQQAVATVKRGATKPPLLDCAESESTSRQALPFR